MSTGEIKLPNGKIIGHRDYRHIYRQRTRLPDQREAIVINKLASEYRKMRAEENGVVLAQTPGNRAKGMINEQDIDESKNGRARMKHQRRAERDRMQIGIKNSTTMMKHFCDPANNV